MARLPNADELKASRSTVRYGPVVAHFFRRRISRRVSANGGDHRSAGRIPLLVALRRILALLKAIAAAFSRSGKSDPG
ncbi:hypothetical protein KCP78_22275 [Salmonella enterica subsp. enterica]|nr:hypothetical protein KCP78_22275 [Salmonella enterica subsp. enterica]